MPSLLNPKFKHTMGFSSYLLLFLNLHLLPRLKDTLIQAFPPVFHVLRAIFMQNYDTSYSPPNSRTRTGIVQLHKAKQSTCDDRSATVAVQ